MTHPVALADTAFDLVASSDISAAATDAATLDSLRRALGAVIRGKDEAIELLLVGLLTGGHVLVEDVPGVGKTTLARALARALSIEMKRVQFTPDLLPSDILGSQILHPDSGRFSFQRGPVFTNLLLADEINRASPRTQSALLEAMSEGQVTVDGNTYALPAPFMVLATQNPVDYQGTYPLPEAQLDRFVLRLALGYPAGDDELDMLFSQQRAHPLESLEAVTSGDALRTLQAQVREVKVKEPVARYILELVRATRQHSELELGASPRGALALFRAGQARALLQGRSFVVPDDVQALAQPVLAHRVMLSARARYGGNDAGGIIAELLPTISVPT